MKTTTKIGHYGLLTVLTFIVAFPLLLGIWISLLPSVDIAAGKFFSNNVSLSNYVTALTTTPLFKYMWNTFVVAALIVFGELVFCTLAAYAFAFIDFRFKKQLFFLFILTMMFPGEARIIANFQTVKWLGWLDSFAGLTVPFMASAFGVFMLRQAFLQVPTELREFSQLVGQSHLEFLMRIVLPYSASTIVTFCLYTFVTHWNMYLWPLIVTFGDSHRTTQIWLKQLQSEYTFTDWGTIMATSMIILLPTLLIIIAGHHFFKNGINAGGLKG